MQHIRVRFELVGCGGKIVDVDDSFIEPVAVRLRGREIGFDLLIADDPSAVGIDEEHAAWLEPTEGVEFSATDVEDPVVTITRNSRGSVVYTFTLAVHDKLHRTPVEDSVEVVVRP